MITNNNSTCQGMVNLSLFIKCFKSSFKAKIGFILVEMVIVEMVIVLLQVFTDNVAEVSISENTIANSFPLNSLLPVQYNKKFSRSTYQKVNVKGYSSWLRIMHTHNCCI